MNPQHCEGLRSPVILGLAFALHGINKGYTKQHVILTNLCPKQWAVSETICWFSAQPCQCFIALNCFDGIVVAAFTT